MLLTTGLIALLLVTTSCSTATTTATTTNSTTTTTTTRTTTTPNTTVASTTATTTTATTTPATSTVLTVINGSNTQTYTLAQLKALQSVTGWGAKNKGGTVSGTDTYVGVRLTTLIKSIGGMTSSDFVKITGSDGYSKTLSWTQVYQGTFNVYDLSGNSVTAGTQPFVSLIYIMDGNDLDATTGPVETGIITMNGQASDASLWIKQTIKVEILKAVTLNVSAASSLSNVLKAIDALYTKSNPNVTISLNTGASGTLQTQIENGAPADVFLSAASANMDTLQNENLIINSSRKNLLNNTLVMIVPVGSTLGLTSFNDLTLAKVTKIAIGDPKSVPAGAYAQAAFNELGITSQIQSKFILGANVTQVLTYVAGGNVDVGFVYSTDALSSTQVKVVANAPADINAQIIYPAAILKASTHSTAAQAYLDFLSSDQAKALFIPYGFTMAAK
jgi:molybdate transport system substrate-binding protein